MSRILRAQTSLMISRILLTGALLMGLVSVAAAAPSRFYWTNGWTSPDNSGSGPPGTVNRVDADGSNAAVLATLDNSGTTLFRVTDVEIDQDRDALYWTNWNSGGSNSSTDEAIYRSDLDGNDQVLFSNASNSSNGFASGLHRLGIDESTGDVYFTRGVSYANSNGPEVSRVDVNGGNYTELSTGFGWFASGVVPDPDSGLLYWGDSGVIDSPPNGAVNVMGMDGSFPAMLAPWGAGNGQGRSLALDGDAGAAGTVFFSAWTTAGGVFNGPANGGGGLWALDLDSGIVTQILDDPTTGIPDIELDTVEQRIYWTDWVRGEIRSANYDGSDIVTEASGLADPFGLALEFDRVQIPVPLLSGWSLALLMILLAGAGFVAVRMRA